MKDKKLFIIIDGHALLYRAYYALPKLTAPDGRPTGAILGFVKKTLKIYREQNPDALVAIFDAHGPTFRDEISADYKATRSAMPEDLIPQVAMIQQIMPELGVKTLCIDGVEADDVIATLALSAAAKEFTVHVYSGDKDLAALVSDKISLCTPARELDIERVLDREGVFKKFGVYPESIPDYLSLVGDTSDNIQGVRGIGPKTAAKLIGDYGSIEGILSAIDKLSPKMAQAFRDHEQTLPIARSLVKLRNDVELGYDVTVDFTAKVAPTPELIALFERLAFKGVLKEFSAESPGAPVAPVGTVLESPLQIQTGVVEVVATIAVPPSNILDNRSLSGYLEKISAADIAAFDTETTSLSPRDAKLVGVSFAADGIDPAYLPIAHEEFVMDGRDGRDGSWKEALEKYLADPTAIKCGHNLKYDLQIVRGVGMDPQGFVFDTMIASSLVDPLKRSHSLDALALELFGFKKISFDSLGIEESGDFRQVPIDKAAAYSCEDAYVTLQLHRHLKVELEKRNLLKVYLEIEHPLIDVLAAMEWHGVLVDPSVLVELRGDFGNQLAALHTAAVESAGEHFNLDSPKQVAGILFDRLGLPPARKTKTGRSTDQDTLEELKALHPLPGILLDYRELAKLLNTYIVALPELINKKTGRLHTNYNQARTATGRLSSTNPNLQNIPIRTERGRSIRRAFVAASGKTLVAADYSQIEFRVAAYLSGDETLLKAFRDGADLHALTASALHQAGQSGHGGGHSAFEDAHDPEVRRKAKAVNFGILYGQSAFGLSRTLGISRAQASEIIKSHYAAFPRLRAWIAELLARATEQGYVETLFGRRRPIPDLRSSNRNIRSAAERIAINTPFQGTAAEIIKIAMSKIARRFALWPETAIVLQVHDELVIETTQADAPEIERILKTEMIDIPLIGNLLEVNTGIGKNWLQAAH